MAQTTPRTGCRRPMPAIEVGLMMDMGGVPVVLARLRDPQAVRSAVQAAIQAAQQRDDIGGRQEARMLAGLLAEI